MAVKTVKEAREGAVSKAVGKVLKKHNIDSENALHEAQSGRGAAADREAVALGKALERFNPACLDYLKENLGLDLRKGALCSRDVWSLMKGRMVGPVLVTVKPVVYDRKARKSVVSKEPLSALVSVKVGFPYDRRTRKMLAPDEDHRLFVQTSPVRPLVLKSGFVRRGADDDVQAPSAGETQSARPAFTDEQITALESRGVSPTRLFGGHNALSDAECTALAEGRAVEVDGCVKTESGIYVNIHGEVTLSGGKKAEFESVNLRTLDDGSVIPALASVPDSEFGGLRAADFELDLLGACRQGDVEFDLFRRDSNGQVMTYPDGRPICNDAGRNLLEYGHSFGPVSGTVHRGRQATKANYVLSAFNGAVVASAMVEKPVIGEGMKPVTVKIWDRKKRRTVVMPVTRPVVRDITTPDSKVWIDGENAALEFKTHRDFEDFSCGRPAQVSGLTFHDFQKKKDLSYDGFVVFDPTCVFAKPFSPSVSKRIGEARELADKNRSTLKTQGMAV